MGVANQLAEGDLTAKIEVTSKDETGMLLAAMQNMVGKLSQIIGEVRGAADNLSSASEEVSRHGTIAVARPPANRRPAWKRPAPRWNR